MRGAIHSTQITRKFREGNQMELKVSIRKFHNCGIPLSFSENSGTTENEWIAPEISYLLEIDVRRPQCAAIYLCESRVCITRLPLYIVF